MRNKKTILVIMAIVSFGVFKLYAEDLENGHWSKWEQLSTGGGGRSHEITISKYNDEIVYLGADVGGIYISKDGGKTWRASNCGLRNYYVWRIVEHPTNPKIVFLGSEGGVYKTIDGGENWEWLREGFPPIERYNYSAPISALAIDIHNPDTIYAGIGRERYYNTWEILGKGDIYKSIDGGKSWRNLNGKGEAGIEGMICDLAIDPRNNGRIIAATTKGIYISDNNGEKWKLSSKGLPHLFTSHLAMSFTNPDIIYVTLFTQPEGEKGWAGGVYKTVNGGKEWISVNTGIPIGGEDKYRPNPFLPVVGTIQKIIVCPSNSDIVWVTNVTFDSSKSGIYKTIDGGNNWIRITEDNFQPAWTIGLYQYETKNINPYGIGVSPNNPLLLYISTAVMVYKTTDGGKIWKYCYIEWNGKGWTSNGFENTVTNSVIVHPKDPQKIYMLYGDIGMFSSADGGKTVEYASEGMLGDDVNDVDTACFDPDNPDEMWASCGNRVNAGIGRGIAPGYIFHSTDSGKKWKKIGRPDTGLPSDQIYWLLIDPHSSRGSRRLFAGLTRYGIYVSEDGGKTWKPRNEGLPPFPFEYDTEQTYTGMTMKFKISPILTSLAMHPYNSQILYCALESKEGGREYAGGIYKSDNQGKKWMKISETIPNISQSKASIVFSMANPDIMYVGLQKKSLKGKTDASGKINEGGVIKSTDGGRTWQRILGKIKEKVWSIVIDPDNDNHIFVGCHTSPYHDDISTEGVLESWNGGETWQNILDKTFPNYLIQSLTLEKRLGNPILYIGTGGNGFFRIRYDKK